jgi:hypothetical protein
VSSLTYIFYNNLIVIYCHSTNLRIQILLLLFFFLTCPHTREGGEMIRTSNLHFIKRDLRPIELSLGIQTLICWKPKNVE